MVILPPEPILPRPQSKWKYPREHWNKEPQHWKPPPEAIATLLTYRLQDTEREIEIRYKEDLKTGPKSFSRARILKTNIALYTRPNLVSRIRAQRRQTTERLYTVIF